jgi:hypothetical protein
MAKNYAGFVGRLFDWIGHLVYGSLFDQLGTKENSLDGSHDCILGDRRSEFVGLVVHFVCTKNVGNSRALAPQINLGRTETLSFDLIE